MGYNLRLFCALSLFAACFTQAIDSSAAGPVGDKVPSASCDLIELDQVVSDEYLGSQTGRQDTKVDQVNFYLTDIKNSSEFDGNVLSAVGSTITNGANTIGENAFSSASGLVTVIQNSGNQVQILNDLVLNLYLK